MGVQLRCWAQTSGISGTLPFIAFEDRGPCWGFEYRRDMSVSVTEVFFSQERTVMAFFRGRAFRERRLDDLR